MSVVQDSGQEGDDSRRSLGRMLLFSSVDLDRGGLASDVLGVAAAFAFIAGMALLYLLGESWNAMRTVHLMTIVCGLAVGVAGTYDVLSHRPTQLIVPFAHLLVAVLALTLVLRFSGHPGAARSALAWSLGLHLCLLPLTSRLWSIHFGARGSGLDVARKKRLLSETESGESDSLLVRVLESTPGFSEVETIGAVGNGVLRLPTSRLGGRPRPGLVYVLHKALVINRSVPGSEDHGEWARYVIAIEESIMLGDRPAVPNPEESRALASQSLMVLVAITVSLSALAAIASL